MGRIIKISALTIIFVFCVMFLFTSCGREGPIPQSSYIEGLTLNNYPRVDGSTSTTPLNMIIACKLLDINYKWAEGSGGLWEVSPQIEGNSKKKLNELISSRQTHGSIINLIDKNSELILSARTMSPDEKAYAESRGVSLIETPIALDAFIFIINPDNSINSLTTKQIQDIYTGKVTHWYEVGGDLTNRDRELVQIGEYWTYVYGEEYPAPIHPYVRNENSGSQELMELLVMRDLNIIDFPISNEVIYSMTGAFERVRHDINSICYTVYYFKEQMIRREGFVKSIAVDGVYPNRTTISSKSYPYAAEVYAVIRSDLDESSMAYKIYVWLQTETGKQIISESGYIPN